MSGFGGSKFMLTFPCFALLNNSPTVAECVRTGSAECAVVLLTDDDLVRRYKLEHEEALLYPKVAFDSAQELALFLSDYLPRDITHVAFDPTSTKVTTTRISDVIKKALEQTGEL